MAMTGPRSRDQWGNRRFSALSLTTSRAGPVNAGGVTGLAEGSALPHIGMFSKSLCGFANRGMVKLNFGALVLIRSEPEPLRLAGEPCYEKITVDCAGVSGCLAATESCC